MRRVLGKISGLLSNRNMMGVDKTGNKYFTKMEEVDGIILKREEERRAKEGSTGKRVSPGKVAGPDLKSFIRQIPVGSEGSETEESSWARGSLRFTQENKTEKEKVEPKVVDPAVGQFILPERGHNESRFMVMTACD
ncbi:uncharacterized protein LOC107612098 isoform X2 [Arachis ipaensis]|uniref:uncharacterized protein LOC107612098 isoform X2 n=1 Tax=Arachis ipaensis TaxID=130454 RepID=UPI000A2AF285|nr:uncharacterized protein LOC107612098 isoform X2 [Arachis ipaensis]XP_025673487.1 uncharacterized protein LOC112772714 isoform X2 [Arachis hypogaea]